MHKFVRLKFFVVGASVGVAAQNVQLRRAASTISNESANQSTWGEDACGDSETCQLDDQACRPCDCCVLGGSCNTCANGYSVSNSLCGDADNYICNAGPGATPSKPAIQFVLDLGFRIIAKTIYGTQDVETPALTSCGMPSGQCSDADLVTLESDPSGFQTMASDCGASSFSIFAMSLKEDKFFSCLDPTGLSRPCLECSFNQANYAIQECLWECIWDAGSQDCLDCNEAYRPTMAACVGSKSVPCTPAPTPTPAPVPNPNPSPPASPTGTPTLAPTTPTQAPTPKPTIVPTQAPAPTSAPTSDPFQSSLISLSAPFKCSCMAVRIIVLVGLIYVRLLTV